MQLQIWIVYDVLRYLLRRAMRTIKRLHMIFLVMQYNISDLLP